MVELELTSGVPESRAERAQTGGHARTRESTSRRADGRTRCFSANRVSDRSWEAQGERVGQKLLFLWLQESSSGQAGTVAALVGRPRKPRAKRECKCRGRKAKSQPTESPAGCGARPAFHQGNWEQSKWRENEGRGSERERGKPMIQIASERIVLKCQFSGHVELLLAACYELNRMSE